MKKCLSKKFIILLVLVVILIASAIAGSTVYARYSQKVEAGSLTIRVDPAGQLDSTVGKTEYEEDQNMKFDKVHPVYPFG